MQFGQVLTTLQSRHARGPADASCASTRRRSRARARAGFNQAIKHWEDAYRNTSQVNDATRGLERHDLTRVLKGQGAGVRRAVARRGGAQGPGHRPQHARSRRFARQEDNLKAAIPELRDVFREGRPALASLNRALPQIRGFARDALPGARSSLATLDAQLPFVRQAAAAGLRARAARALEPSCAAAVPALARLNSRSPRTFAQNRALAACQNNVLRAVRRRRRSPTPTSPSRHGEPWFEEAGRAFVGPRPGRAACPTPTRPFFRTQAGGGPTTLVSTGEPGERLFGQLLLPINGVRPARPVEAARSSGPNVPCETQEPPDMNAAGRPRRPSRPRASGDVRSNRASRGPREGAPRAVPRACASTPTARARACRRSTRSSGGAWASACSSRSMGLTRDEDGRLVKREDAK